MFILISVILNKDPKICPISGFGGVDDGGSVCSSSFLHLDSVTTSCLCLGAASPLTPGSTSTVPPPWENLCLIYRKRCNGPGSHRLYMCVTVYMLVYVCLRTERTWEPSRLKNKTNKRPTQASLVLDRVQVCVCVHGACVLLTAALQSVRLSGHVFGNQPATNRTGSVHSTTGSEDVDVGVSGNEGWRGPTRIHVIQG